MFCDLVFTAPAGCAGGFAEADQAGVGVDADEKERRDGMRAAATAADGELRLERDADRDGFEAGDFHKATQKYKTAITHPR